MDQAERLSNYQWMKAIEKTDEETGNNKAIELINSESLDIKILAALLEDSISGRYCDKDKNVIKLNEETVRCGFIRLLCTAEEKLLASLNN